MKNAECPIAPGDILVAQATPPGPITRVDPNSGDTRVVFSGGEIEQENITGLELDGDGNLLCSLFDRIVRIDVQTGKQTRIAGIPELRPPSPTFWSDIAPTSDNRLFATVEKPAAFVEVDQRTGSISEISLPNPASSLEPGPEGRLFVAAEGKLIRFDPSTGNIEVVVEQNARSNDFAVTDAGEILVVRDQELVRFQAGSTSPEVISSGGLLTNPHGIAIEANGNAIVSDLRTGTITRITIATGEQHALVSSGVFESAGRLVVVPAR